MYLFIYLNFESIMNVKITLYVHMLTGKYFKISILNRTTCNINSRKAKSVASFNSVYYFVIYKNLENNSRTLDVISVDIMVRYIALTECKNAFLKNISHDLR